jgi:cysteinyl-tRNA synthetase
VFEDILRRTLESFGHSVRHVMNITDVGHLQSDADVGDDKMEVAARRERRSTWDIARHYEFLSTC